MNQVTFYMEKGKVVPFPPERMRCFQGSVVGTFKFSVKFWGQLNDENKCFPFFVVLSVFFPPNP